MLALVTAVISKDYFVRTKKYTQTYANDKKQWQGGYNKEILHNHRTGDITPMINLINMEKA